MYEVSGLPDTASATQSVGAPGPLATRTVSVEPAGTAAFVEPFTVIIGAGGGGGGGGGGDVVPAGAFWDTVKLLIVMVMNISTPAREPQSKGWPLPG